jgi:transcriptional regulator with GAF, ATPase, and Fis domain
MSTDVPILADKRRILQVETLYELALALQAHRPEAELVDELLLRVCTVVDPAAAVAVTRDAYGGSRAVAAAGWTGDPPEGRVLLEDRLWQQLLAGDGLVTRREGELAGRAYQELVAAPLTYRGVYLGYLAVLDKEARGSGGSSFTDDDRRFLDSVAALAAVSLDSARQVERLETQRQRLAEENKALKGRLVEDVAGQRIVAQAPAMRRVLERVERVAPRGVNVLVRGESGTGKELVAKLLHLLSGREGPLIALNCAALPESLLESELFGIERGVATGVQERVGKFELADGGSLFLDEIGDLQPSVQMTLLRSLQEREILRVGGQRSIPVDVRLVAATHRDLEALVDAGHFREDLYYRLKGVEIDLPSLRERRTDILQLVRYFAEQFCRREGIPVPTFTPDAQAFLLEYHYPGNVRELQNLVEGAVSLAERQVDPELVRSIIGSSSETPTGALDLDTVERRHIAHVLSLTDGNKSAAARLLGVDRRTLLRKGF